MHRPPSACRAHATRLLALLGAGVWTPCAAAQDLAGAWTAGPTRFRVEVSSWGPDCGPRPASSTRPAEGRVAVTTRGDHLVFGPPVGLQTDGCWSENRALRRVSSTVRDGTWTTRCRTALNDARAESGTYTLRAAGADRLERSATSEYNWQLNESRCVATLTETQSFERVGGAPGAVAAAGATAGACRPGAADKLRLRPDRAAIEPGAHVCFRVELVDAAGCALPEPALAWRLERPPGLEGQLRGRCFYAGGSAATAEGSFVVTVESGGLAGTAAVAVRTADLSDLRAQRIARDDAAERLETARAEEAARLAARTARSPWRQTAFWVAILAGAALLVLAVATALVIARGRTAEAALAAGPSDHPATVPAPPPRPLSGAPVAAPAEPEPSSAPSAEGHRRHKICPVCRRGYPEGTDLCPQDAVLLLEYQAFVALHRDEADHAARRRVCPVCGTTYDAETRFCGRDGSELVDYR